MTTTINNEHKKLNVPNLRFPEFQGEWEKHELGGICEIITDFVAAGSFASLRENVKYYQEDNYAQLVRTVDLKKDFTNNDFVYVDEFAYDFLWRVQLKEPNIVLPNIGANIGEKYYVSPKDLPKEKNVLGPNAILLRSKCNDTHFVFFRLSTSSYDNECALSKDEAIKKAEEFQNKLGRASQVYIGTSDYEWSAGVIEDGDDTVKTDDKESVIKDTAWGYIIDYGEGVDGIAFCKSLDFTRNMDIWETPDNYDDFMPYGSSSFIVTDQGVTEFTVSYPVDIVNESKNVELLSMDTIKEIIKDDMTKNSDQYDFTQNHTYNNLKLGYIRLKDASDKDKCTYVPAWCLSKQDKGYDRYPVYVNAIDGTIIRSDDLI